MSPFLFPGVCRKTEEIYRKLNSFVLETYGMILLVS